MSSLSRLCLAIAALVLLGLPTACGFQPVYGGGEPGGPSAELEKIAVARVPDRVGHRLRGELERLFDNYGHESAYTLGIELEDRTSVVAVDRDSSKRRRNLRLVAMITLSAVGGEVPLYQTRIVSDAGIDQLPSDFATLVAEDAAEQRAVERLARDIRQRLAVYFARRE